MIDKFDDELSLILRRLKNGGDEDDAHDDIMQCVYNLLDKYDQYVRLSLLRRNSALDIVGKIEYNVRQHTRHASTCKRNLAGFSLYCE